MEMKLWNNGGVELKVVVPLGEEEAPFYSPPKSSRYWPKPACPECIRNGPEYSGHPEYSGTFRAIPNT